MKVDLALIGLHVIGNVFWIGSIIAVALILLADKPDAKARGALAQMLYLRLAAPAFVLSFVAGFARFIMDVGNYGKAPWMHIKLTFALAAIALHHVIGARAKKMANGDVSDAGPTKGLMIGLAVCAAVAVFMVIMKVPAGR
jgi:protoporphyrinogen IX oxidase